MQTRKMWRWLSLVVVLGLLMSILPAVSAQPSPAEDPATNAAAVPQQDPPPPERPLSRDGGLAGTERDQKSEPEPQRPTLNVDPAALVPAVSEEEAVAKLHPDLRPVVQAATLDEQEPILVQVFTEVRSNRERDWSSYFVDGLYIARPELDLGDMTIQQIVGRAYPTNVMKMAYLGQVQAITEMRLEQTGEPEPYPADEPREEPEIGPEDWADLQARADRIRGDDIPWSEARAFGDGREMIAPQDWFEVSPDGPHMAQVAWDRGYTGEGVSVAVIDDGIDPAHPDLMGTQKIYSSTVRPEYNGWPMVYSPMSMLIYFNDDIYGTSFIPNQSYPTVHYIDTSEMPATWPCATDVSCFNFRPLIASGTPGTQHTYVISDDMTTSGEVHVGTHQDEDLRDYIWGEKVAVLVTDPNTPGVYDTVYVDLDNDYDFRDEKPLTRADVNDPSTYNDMVAYRDLNGDGLADISGGMVYFIADGVNPIPGSDILWYPMIPTNGDLVAFSGATFDGGYSHGTQCASNVVGQGVVDGMLPSFRDLPGDGVPAGAVFGMAPDAEMVNISDVYWDFTNSKLDAYGFAALGYDGIPSGNPADTDGIQITSNSYGWSYWVADGWDFDGQYVSWIQRNLAPYTQYLFSTGNGAPAYGTINQPQPSTGIMIGASTEFGSTGWDSITDTHQIMYNDVTPFSDRGPGARGTHGPDVVAGGAFAAGDEKLNYYSASMWGAPDGNLSWVSWGGTSRSAPVAMGVLALIYDAYYEANGVWPTYDEAEALFMSTATDLNYDVFTQGAGSANADRGTAVAGGHYGVYAMPHQWQPGDYRGNDYPGFAHLTYPGETWSEDFAIHNSGTETVTLDVDDAELMLIDSVEFDFDITAAQTAQEDDNFYKAFQYFIPITATAGMDSAWYNIDVPADTDLMIVRQMFPYEEFDADGDYAWDNRVYLMVYNWQDDDNDGIVWDDVDSNGVVNFVTGSVVTQIDGGMELDWDHPDTELDRWEYGRFSYHRPGGNRNEMWVHDPLDRMIDGLFIGLRHLTANGYNGETHLSYRIDFYREEDVPWLDLDTSSLEVGPGMSETIAATATVPLTIPTGVYQAAIQIHDPGWMTYTADTTVIPVTLNVVEDFSDGMELGGMDTYLYDQDRPYNNAAVRGLFDWTWREESGDWRFFFSDLENCEADTIFYEDFETWPLTGWDIITYTSGVSNAWESGTVCGYANNTGGSGDYATVNSDCHTSEVFDTELRSPAFDLSDPTIEEVSLSFQTDFWVWDTDEAMVLVSDDGGANWDVVADWTTDQSGGVSIPLDDYIGSANVMVSFWYTTNGSTYQGWWQVDDVEVSSLVCEYPVDTKILLRDQWEDEDGMAPYSDIDSYILGPFAGSYGSWGSWPVDPAHDGPYTLEVVGNSPIVHGGTGGTWIFDTTSGANEDWVTAPLPDWRAEREGLHQFQQHNVLFEGLDFDVVFTKTVGTLYEDYHSFSVDTYLDAGTVGTVTLESTLDLNGIVADSVLYEVDHTTWDDEPLDFIDDTTIEWTYQFSIQDAIDMEIWTSSADIDDIDLYLFYWNGSTWVQMGSSTSSDATEEISVSNPSDGDWMIGVLNWSGPAGHFDMDLVVRSQIGELDITGTTGDPIAAGTPIPLGIHYDFPMTPGTCYQGLVFMGPPEAPELKTVDVEICREPESAMIMKEVDWETAFPGMDLVYTVDLFNLSDPDAYFEMVDPIPENTEFVDFTPCCYFATMFEEDFEGSWPPDGWTVHNNSGGDWNTNTYWGETNRTLPYGSGQSAAADANQYGSGMDTELWSPPIDLTGCPAPMLRFGSNFQDFAGNGDAWVDVSTDGGSNWTNEYYQTTDDPSMTSGVLREIDLSAYVGETIIIRWHFSTPDWDWYWQIDDVMVGAEMCTDPVYDADQDQVVFTGTLPLGSAYVPAPFEGFEGGVLPEGWEIEHLGSGVEQWEIMNDPAYAHTGDYLASLWWDTTPWDEWLYSPYFEVGATGDTTLSFYALSVVEPTYDYSMLLHVIDEDGVVVDTLWDMTEDETWTWDGVNLPPYHLVEVDMSAYAGENVRLAWHGVGDAYFIFLLDDITLPGLPSPIYYPSCSIDVTVHVTDTVMEGDWITNTATLEATHDLEQELQVEDPVTDHAVTHIGAENFITSYKTGPEMAPTGEIIMYEIHVINSGDALETVTLTDTIPANTTLYDYDDSPPYHAFTYNATEDQMEWTGNIAPGEEWVFTYWLEVDADITLWGDMLQNTAYLAWEDTMMPLMWDAEIVPPYNIYVPMVLME